MALKDNLTYEFLYQHFLQSETSGFMGDFNKKYFPDDYEEMKKALEDLKRDE